MNKYYLSIALRVLKDSCLVFSAINFIVFGWYEYLCLYEKIGWFFGLFTYPAACSIITLFLGYTIGLSIVSQGLHLHLPISKISSDNVYLIHSHWSVNLNLFFVGLQSAAFIYCLFFPTPYISLH
jgi:hypothetical protein